MGGIDCFLGEAMLGDVDIDCDSGSDGDVDGDVDDAANAVVEEMVVHLVLLLFGVSEIFVDGGREEETEEVLRSV